MIFKPGHGWRGGGRPLDAELIRTARVQLMQVFGECINELAPHSAFGSIENRAGAVRERLLSALKTNALLAPVI
jgi:hypothetical protein